MTLVFYPHEDDLNAASLSEKLDALLDGAERFKAIILEEAAAKAVATKKKISPREITASYNWEQIASVLSEIRELPEGNQATKLTKADYLTKLAEVYEVLRGAKMTKLEAVRIALVNEAAQLKASASQVA